MIAAQPAVSPRTPATRVSAAPLGALCALATAAWLFVVVAASPPAVAFGVLVPGMLFAAALGWLQRGDRRPAVLIVAMLLWGAAAAAPLARAANDLVRAWFALFAGGDARELTATIAAPVVEEVAKAAGLVLVLLVARRALRGVRDGIVYGAAVGIGFVVAENLLYLAFAMLAGGAGGLARAVYVRGVVAGLDHAVFTATLGAGIGAAAAAASPSDPPGARPRAARLLVVAAAAAVAQHLVWNALAAPALVAALCGAAIAGGPCRDVPAARDLVVTVPVVAALALGPGVAALLVLYRRDGASATPEIDAP